MVGATCERNEVISKAVPMLNKEPYLEKILDNGYIYICEFFLSLILASKIYALDYTNKETSVEATENGANTHLYCCTVHLLDSLNITLTTSALIVCHLF